MIGFGRIGLLVVWQSGSTNHRLKDLKDLPRREAPRHYIIVHIDDTAISRSEPCLPPSYSTCFHAETRVHFCFLIINDTCAFAPKTPTVPLFQYYLLFLHLGVAVNVMTLRAPPCHRNISAPILGLSALARTGVTNVQISRWGC